MRTSTGARYVVVPGVGRLDQREDDWRDSATCAVNPVVDRDIFFSSNHAEMDAAKRICATCPVMNQCRAWGDVVEDATLSNIYGVLGGEAPIDRAARRRREAGLEGKIDRLNWDAPHACLTCGRLMRHRRVRLEESPGTVLYGGKGLCFDCHRKQGSTGVDIPAKRAHRKGRKPLDWGSPRFCHSCGQKMRPARMRSIDAPGTLAYGGKGLCSTCHKRQGKAARND